MAYIDDPEELYNRLLDDVRDYLGHDITDEADSALGDVCRLLVVEPSIDDMDDERGENAYWQCYSKEGNDRMEAAFRRLVLGLRAGAIKRVVQPGMDGKSLTEAIRDELDQIGDGAEYGHMDTEPQTVLAQRLNPILDELGYKEISRWEW